MPIGRIWSPIWTGSASMPPLAGRERDLLAGRQSVVAQVAQQVGRIVLGDLGDASNVGRHAGLEIGQGNQACRKAVSGRE